MKKFDADRRPRLSLIAPLLALGVLSCAGKPEAPPPAKTPPPPEATAPVDGADEAGASPAASSGSSPRIAPWARSGISDWKTPPASTAEPLIRPPAPSTFKLPGGLNVVVVPRHTLPLVSLRLIVRGAGSAADPRRQPGLAAFTADLLDEGAGKRSALEIAKEIEQLGASLETGVTADHGYLAMQTLSRTFEPAFALLAAIATRPTFAPAEGKRLRTEWVDALKARQDRSREVAALVFSQTLYGKGSAYGHPASGFVASAKKLDAKAARKFHKSHWRPEVMTLVIVGDIDIVALQQTVKKRFGRFRPRGRKLRLKAPKAPPAKAAARLSVVNRPGAPQSELRAGVVALARSDPRFAAFEVVTTLLGGGFTSRLNHRLREELGYTYGVRAQQLPREARGPFLIASAFHTPKTSDAVKEILRMVDEVATTPVPPAELTKVKLNLIRALPTRFETNAQVADTFADLAAHGLPLTWYDGYEASIRSVDAATVQKLASELIPADALRFTLVGDLAQIETGLTGSLGEAVHLDSEGRPAKAQAKGR